MRIWHVNVGNHAGPVDGVAVISAIFATDNAEAAARRLRNAVDGALAARGAA